MGQPSDEAPQGEPQDFPVAELPGRAQPGIGPIRDSAAPSPPEQQNRRPASGGGSLAWGFAAFLLGYGGYYVVGLISSDALPPRSAGFDPTRPPDLGPLLLLAFAPNLLLGLVPAVFSWVAGRGLRADFGIVPTRRDLKVGFACGAGALVVSWVFIRILISVSGLPPEERISQLAHGPKSIWLLLFVLFAFLGAPLTEELLMRGALWGALEHYRVPRAVILPFTALIFAFIHQELWRLPILFAGGIAIGLARMITGRVGASMVAHATNNFLPALVLFATAG